ncbi:hypothetical protein HU200_036040 [Digitaria exilis]|uniref:BHLH domain-containing protein n=1 Tax=Digitaria exilis TaxID=1010633 RepID=A0A835BT06_9POAL|nr:hypothetical protein HU200_036040 [Digitaria exilis]
MAIRSKSHDDLPADRGTHADPARATVRRRPVPRRHLAQLAITLEAIATSCRARAVDGNQTSRGVHARGPPPPPSPCYYTARRPPRDGPPDRPIPSIHGALPPPTSARKRQVYPLTCPHRAGPRHDEMRWPWMAASAWPSIYSDGAAARPALSAPATYLLPSELVDAAMAEEEIRRIRRRGGRRRPSSSRAALRRKVRELRRLVPGGDEAPEGALLARAADYIAGLRARVELLRALAAVYEVAAGADECMVHGNGHAARVITHGSCSGTSSNRRRTGT